MNQLSNQLALADETRQFELLLRGVTDYAIYMLDPTGIIRSWNAGGERIKGYHAREVVGRHFSIFYTPEDATAGLPARSLATARAEGRFEAEGWRMRKDGSRFYASVVIDPIWEQEELIGFAKVTRDITERVEAQRGLEAAQKALAHSQKMEAIGKLTLGLAHDFNNLLTIIINSLDLIAERPGADERTKSLVETALCASDRGALLSRQLLAFGRGQSLAPERHNVNALLELSMELYRRACGSDVDFDATLMSGLPDVEVDVSQFEAAILNLVTNSRDAMAAGGRIGIRTSLCHAINPNAPEHGEQTYVCVEVQDNGVGIPEDVRDRVFEPFFTTKEVGKGSGLGLSQVFGFAAQSGGFATLSSTPGLGTRVSICLPAEGDPS